MYRELTLAVFALRKDIPVFGKYHLAPQRAAKNRKIA
jgi:hypothetical protein